MIRPAGARRWQAARDMLAVAVGTLLILAAIAANGRPTVFTDTDDYYTLGRDIVQAGIALVAPAPPPDEPPSAEEIADAVQAADDAHMGHTQMASRSAVYGVFLYLAERLGTLWLVAAIQSAIVAWLMFVLWRAAVPAAPVVHYLGGMAMLAVASTLPFFAGFAMPDVFAGVAAIAVVLLLVYPDRIGRGVRALIALLLVFAMAIHTSHVLFVVPLAIAGAVALGLAGVPRRDILGRVAVIGVSLVAAIVANNLYGLTIRLQTGEPLRNQPFLMARLLADGPGRAYLRHACAEGATYTLCRFRHKPLNDSEDILWSDLPATGVFLLSDYRTRMRLENEEGRFVLGTLAYDPLGQTGASLGNWAKQMAQIQVDDPLRNPVYYLTDPYWRETSLPLLINRVATCGRSGRDCPSRLTVAVSRRWHGAMLGLAVAAIVWSLDRMRRRGRRGGRGIDRRLLAMLGLFGAAIVLNAAVCGMLSGPFARYQSRLVWLLPAAAGLMVSATLVRRREAGHTAAGPTGLARA